MNKFFPRIAYSPEGEGETEPVDPGIEQKPTLLNQSNEEDKDGDPPAEDQKPEGEAEKDKETPSKFDLEKLEMPEGFEIPEDKRGALSEIATKHGLSNEALKDLMDLQAGTIKEKAEAPYRLWQTTQTEWQSQVKADSEIGGDKLPATLQTVSKALDQYGTPGVKAALDFTGAGNNPEIVKTFYNMAKALSEGAAVQGKPPNEAPMSAAQAIYPHLKDA